jgi:hypothetical protein
MRRGVLVVLLWLYGSIVFVSGLVSLGGSSWKVVVDDRIVVFFAGEEVWSCSLCSRLERMVLVVLENRLLIFVGGTTSVSAAVAYTCLTAEVMRPALRKLGSREVGLEDLVGSSIV